MNYKNTQSTGNLMKRQIDKTVYDKVKNNIEMKDCTFKPSVSKKSQKLIQRYNDPKDQQAQKEKKLLDKAKKIDVRKRRQRNG